MALLRGGRVTEINKFIILNNTCCTWVRPVAQACLTPRDGMDCSLPGSSVCGILAGRNTGVGSHFLLLGTFLTQGSNWHLLYLLHWQTDSLPLVPPGKPLFVFIFVVLKPHQLLKTQIGSNWGTSLSHFFTFKSPVGMPLPLKGTNGTTEMQMTKVDERITEDISKSHWNLFLRKKHAGKSYFDYDMKSFFGRYFKD